VEQNENGHPNAVHDFTAFTQETVHYSNLSNKLKLNLNDFSSFEVFQYQMMEWQFFEDTRQPLLVDGFDDRVITGLFGQVRHCRFLQLEHEFHV